LDPELVVPEQAATNRAMTVRLAAIQRTRLR
jgi:hypothetical protein